MKLRLIFVMVIVLLSLTNMLYAQIISADLILPRETSTINAGQSFLFQISLIQQGEQDIRDVGIRYLLKDLDDNIITFGEQTVSLQTRSSIVATLPAPDYLKTGTYILVVEVREINKDLLLSTASDSIFIREMPFYQKIETKSIYNLGLFLIVFSLVLLLLVIVLYLRIRILGKLVTESSKLRIHDIVRQDKN